MTRVRLAHLGLVAGIAFAALPTAAAPFKCPRVGGTFTFAQEANVNSLDEMTSGTISTHDVALNIFEELMTRDENNRPILDLADQMVEAPDHLTYTFKLRQGVAFHNGKPLTSADVIASFERYKRIGLLRNTLDAVGSWEAPDSLTFVLHMKSVAPTFIDQLSSFNSPVVIVPAEARDDPPQQLRGIGTGPWQITEFTPGSQTRFRRFDAYKANTNFETRNGYGGYKQACFDTVVFRIVTEPGARVAGLKTGELQGVEDVPTKSAAELKSDKNIVLIPLENWWIQIAVPNTSVAPTDNLQFRQAVQAVLDMDEIMDAATDGNYRLNVGFQYPYQASYTDAGRETYNIKDPARAKQYLAASGYKGEPVILLTAKDYPAMYNSALVMSEQMKSIGINAQLKVVDWPTSVQMAQKPDTGWNFFYTGWGTPTAIGALNVMQNVGGASAMQMPKPDRLDQELLAAFHDMSDLPTAEGRQAAFVRTQKIALERVYAVPFGSLTKVQAVRANVKGFAPARIPRLSNVWFGE
jgi:peptide/nickel transport system substrate-binding protein